jgi:glycosyltransferase involved in cell wall biosynthesis
MRGSVTFVSSHAQPGGSEAYLETLLRELDPGSVRGVVSLQRGPANDRFREAGHDPVVIHTSGSYLSMLASTWRLRRFLNRHRPDVVHANGVKAALMCVLATRRIPVIWLKHDFSWDGRLARIVARLCARVIAVSEAVVEGLPRRDNVDVVRPGVAVPDVDRQDGRRLLRDLLQAPADAPVITLVGRFHSVKGHHELLEVVPGLLARFPGLRVALIGGDDPNQLEYAAGVRQQIESLRLGGQVKALGHRRDIVQLIAGSDVIVVPSVRDDRGMGRESLSLVTVEAMLLGTPVVAYDHGGVPEALGDTGYLVPPGDRWALGEAIGTVLSDPRSSDRMAERARERATELFSLSRSIDLLSCHYRAVARPARR